MNEQKELDAEIVEKLPTSQMIGNYRVIRTLGKGGMGAVYEVEHNLLKRRYALKVLAPDRIPDATAIQRFRAEAHAVSGLEHPGLLRISEFGVSQDGQPFLVTDLFDGLPIGDFVRTNEAVDLNSTLHIMQQAASALAHAHDRGVIHRDIKPSNILVKSEDNALEVKIIDFGIAKQLEADIEGAPTTLTATGEILGTPQYMSPEQCNGSRLDARTDIYSLGCVFYFLLTGFPPFSGEGFMHLMMQHISTPPPEISIKSQLGRSLANVTMKCLEKDPSKRYQNLHDLQNDLASIGRGVAVKRRRSFDSKFSKRLKNYAVIAVIGCITAFAAASYEIWAAPLTVFMNLPLMNRNQAETLNALRQANSFRVSGTLGIDKVDKRKFEAAEACLLPFVNQNDAANLDSARKLNSWNLDAAHKLATLYVMDNQLEKARALVWAVSGGDKAVYATYLHHIGVSTDHANAPAHAWPVMNEAHSLFQEQLPLGAPEITKELFNMSQADYRSGNNLRAANELADVIPKLNYFNPALLPIAREQLAELRVLNKTKEGTR